MGFSKWLYGPGKEGVATISKPGIPEIELLDEKLFGKNRYRLIETYTYEWELKINETDGSQRRIIVPKNGSFVKKLKTICTTTEAQRHRDSRKLCKRANH